MAGGAAKKTKSTPTPRGVPVRADVTPTFSVRTRPAIEEIQVTARYTHSSSGAAHTRTTHNTQPQNHRRSSRVHIFCGTLTTRESRDAVERQRENNAQHVDVALPNSLDRSSITHITSTVRRSDGKMRRSQLACQSASLLIIPRGVPHASSTCLEGLPTPPKLSCTGHPPRRRTLLA